MGADAPDLHQQACDLAEAGEFSAAAASFKTLITSDPERAELHEQLAQCLLELEEYEAAYLAAQKAVDMAPSWVDGLVTFSRAAVNAVRLQEALQAYSKAAKYSPPSLELQTELRRAEDLRQRQIAQQIGLPGMRIKQDFDGCAGPGSVVWDCGLVLAKYLTAYQKDTITGRHVLELGAGTGIVGIAAAALGAQVLLTDVPSMQALLAENLAVNADLVKQASGSASAAILDWHDPDPSISQQTFDVVLGADLIFSDKNIQYLTSTLRQGIGLAMQNPIAESPDLRVSIFSTTLG